MERKSHNLLGTFFVSLCALVWGFAFVFQQQASSSVPFFTFNGLRFSLAVAVIGLMLVVNFFVDKKRAKKSKPFNKATLIGGALCGICLFLANNLQQYGIEHTSVGKTGFITALYIVIVPMLGILVRHRVSPFCKFAIAIGVLGFYLMCMTGADVSFTEADGMLLLCAVMFSLQIMFIDQYVDETDPFKLTFVQFVVAALLSLPAMAVQGFPPASALSGNILSILYVGIFSAGIGFTLQTVGQKYTPPELCTLIMSLESVIALVSGVAILGETYTAKEFVGCLLVLFAVFLAQQHVPQIMLKVNDSKFFID